LIPILAAALIVGAGMAAHAQAPGRSPSPDRSAEGKPAPRPQLTREQRLEQLFMLLKQAPSAQVAQAVETRIEAMMLQSGSDTADLLISRARGMIEAKDYDLALRLLDALIEIAPDFTEAYAQRATVHYLKKDLYRSLADLRVVVAREPRHFSALAGLGVILQDIGQQKLALDAFRRAVELHPYIKQIPELIKRLEPQVEGREI
jgi:tetratricopeptide (TPR) repeat protein